MSNDLVPVSEEQAKAVAAVAEATGKGIDAVSQFLSYWAGVFDTAPHDLFAWLVGDRLHHKRIRNLHKIMQETEAILEQRKVKEPRAPSEDIAAPLFEAARQQDHEELQHLWAQLLANAMDPERTSRVRQEFVETLKRLHPRDALSLRLFSDEPDGQLRPNARAALMEKLRLSQDEAQVTLDALEQAKCLFKSSSNVGWFLTPFGRELMRACAP